MKKIFLCALAAAALTTACNKAEVIDVVGTPAIQFENAFVNNATRAAVDPSTTTENITEFSVWGFMDETTGAVLTNEKVWKNGSAWTYANTQYWYPNHNYFFAAVSPVVANGPVTVNTADANANGLGIINFTNEEGIVDLLYTAEAVVTGEDVSAMAPVAFTFNHMLSKVKFSFTNGFDNPNTTLKVTGIKLNKVPAAGSINVAQADWWSTNEWELGEGTITLDFGDAAADIAQGATVSSVNERLTIPADQTQEYEVVFTVAVYNGDVEAMKHELSATIKGAELKIGKAYNFKAELNANNIMPEDQKLYPIEFEVVKVKDWEEGNDVYAGYNVDTAEELAEAVAAGGDIYLTSDVTANITVAADKNVKLFLNGYTLTGLVENKGTLAVNNGKVVYKDETQVVRQFKNTGVLYLNNVNVESSGYTVYALGQLEDGKTLQEQGAPTVTVAINGGEFTSTSSQMEYAMVAWDNSLIEISNAKVTGARGAIYTESGNINITNSEIISQGNPHGYPVYILSAANVNVDDATVFTSAINAYKVCGEKASTTKGEIIYNGVKYTGPAGAAGVIIVE